MINSQIAFIFLFINNLLFAQYVPERFAIKTSDLAENLEVIEKNYKFYVGVMDRTDNDDFINNETKSNPFDDHRSKKSIYTYVYALNDFGNPTPTLMLKIEKRNKFMNINLRLDHVFSEAEIIFFDDFSFKEGTYFFDMCKSYVEFEVKDIGSYQLKYEKNYSISMNNLEQHKITVKGIEALKKECPCK